MGQFWPMGHQLHIPALNLFDPKTEKKEKRKWRVS